MSLVGLSLVICTLDEHEAIGGVLAEAVLARATADPRVRLIRRRQARDLASAAITDGTRRKAAGSA